MLRHLGEISAEAARKFGDKTALIVGEDTYSFSDIDALACQLAGGLASLGVGAGDIVTLYSENRLEWLVTYYGVTKLGAVINPINVMLTPDEVRYVVQDCGAKAIVASRVKAEPLVGIEDGSQVRAVISFDTPPEGATGFDALLAANHPCPSIPDVAPESLSVEP